jgi:hypothetical protein
MEIGLENSYIIDSYIIPIAEYLTAYNYKNFKKNFRRGDVNDCWNWEGSLNSDGYSKFVAIGVDGHRRTLLGHRFGFAYIHGPVKTNTYVLHDCNNPTCVNPFHVRIGSAHRNSLDVVNSGNMVQPMAKLTHDDVEEILDKASRSVMTLKQLAAVFHVNRQSISNIVNGKTFREITVPFLADRELPI